MVEESLYLLYEKRIDILYVFFVKSFKYITFITLRIFASCIVLIYIFIIIIFSYICIYPLLFIIGGTICYFATLFLVIVHQCIEPLSICCSIRIQIVWLFTLALKNWFIFFQTFYKRILTHICMDSEWKFETFISNAGDVHQLVVKRC